MTADLNEELEHEIRDNEETLVGDPESAEPDARVSWAKPPTEPDESP